LPLPPAIDCAGGFDRPLPMLGAICRCLRAFKGAILARHLANVG
jgi:hypothetical protein